MADKEEDITTHVQDTETETDSTQLSGKRIRKHSEKGIEYFLDRKQARSTKIDKMWTEINILKDTKWEDFNSVSLLETYEIDLTHKYKLYTKLCLNTHNSSYVAMKKMQAKNIRLFYDSTVIVRNK
jgi:hypothetical protein